MEWGIQFWLEVSKQSRLHDWLKPQDTKIETNLISRSNRSRWSWIRRADASRYLPLCRQQRGLGASRKEEKLHMEPWKTEWFSIFNGRLTDWKQFRVSKRYNHHFWPGTHDNASRSRLPRLLASSIPATLHLRNLCSGQTWKLVYCIIPLLSS